ncbi:HEAT repeat domain-containing protein, partial [Collinsella aerofaciens]|uniref:HEAT repeat domain-containing protein n=1 Tax=Collinsella aerofaciens TaxID=74426 RepID=UPI0018A9608A
MAENKDEQLTDEELTQLQLAEENENAVDRLVKELGCPTRRIRQFAARVLHLLAERDPQRVVPCVPALIEALDRPEAQTRWEALDALTALATTCPEQLGDAFEGAETALFDEISSTLRYAAFRLLCVWGATSVERSREAWPILDEAIQCYHGDLEYRDMLG